MNKTISQLEEKIDLQDDDVFLIENEEGTYKVNKTNLFKEIINEQNNLQNKIDEVSKKLDSSVTSIVDSCNNIISK